MTGLKIGLLFSTVGMVGLAQINPVTAGTELGRMGAQAILGIVCVACVIALVKVYKNQQQENSIHQEKLYKLIEATANATTETAKAGTETAAAIRTNTSLMVEVKDTIKECKKK